MGIYYTGVDSDLYKTFLNSIYRKKWEYVFDLNFHTLKKVFEWLKIKTKIVFESDFFPERVKSFISQFSTEYYGINYDIGNSASLGFDPKEEIKAYGRRILNVHVKDRFLHGTTVPLGQGNAEIPKVLEELDSIGYNGNYILQTARSDDDHIGVLCQYRDQVIKLMK